MFETVLLIGVGAVAAWVLLNFLNRSAKQRHAVDPDSLTAELQHLAHQKDHHKNNPKSDTEVQTAGFLGAQETRASDRGTQPVLAEAEAKVRAALQTKTPPQTIPGTPDEIYIMDANMADIESGDGFKEFARQKYQSGHYPMPDATQMEQIAGIIDQVSKKKSEFAMTSPIAVVRKARADHDVTKDKNSWLGGKPILGFAVWPRTSKNVPMHHWASISLADLHDFDLPPGMPDGGRLAFFVHAIDPPYEGKVVYVTDGNAFAQPPDDLPIIDHDSKFMFGSADYSESDAPTEHPHWAVEFMALPSDIGKSEHTVVRRELENRFPETSNFNLNTQSLGKIYFEKSELILWDAVMRYADRMAAGQGRFKSAIKTAQMKVRAGEDGAVAALDYLNDCLNAVGEFVEKVRGWAEPKNKWAVMTADERSQFEALLEWELPERFGLGFEADTAVRGNNQAVKNIAEDVSATFQFLAENWEQYGESMPQEVRQVVTAYREVSEPFAWDTAKRCADTAALAETNLDKTLQAAQKDVAGNRDGAAERLAYLEAHTDELRAFISDFQNWVAPHEAWSKLGDSDKLALKEYMSRVTPTRGPDFGLAEYFKIPKARVSLQDACDATLRSAARGEERLYQLVPPTLKELLDGTHRLPERFNTHQMFGEGVSRQVAREEHPY